MRISELEAAAQRVISLLSHYSRPPDREMLLDGILYAYLDGCFGSMSRQHHVKRSNGQRPSRIDFRFGGNNPSMIEFAVRPARGGGQLYGSQNRSELSKLIRVPQARARRRLLLLIDLHHDAITQSRLEPTYKCLNAGPGRFGRHSVRVVYVHRALSYSFLWRGYA